MSELGNWFDENMGWVAIAVTLLFAAGLVWASNNEVRERAEFMADCQKHRPKYECSAMWRAGKRSGNSTVVVPMPVPAYR